MLKNLAIVASSSLALGAPDVKRARVVYDSPRSSENYAEAVSSSFKLGATSETGGFQETLTFVDSENYYGPIYVGTVNCYPSGDNYIQYNLQSEWSYFPLNNVTDGWYDPSTTTSSTNETTTGDFTDVGGWSGTYNVYSDIACISNTTLSPIDTCTSGAYQFRAVTTLTTGDCSTFKGILGLGQLTSNDSNFVVNWGNDQGIDSANQAVYLNMGFSESDSTIRFGNDTSATYTYLGVSTSNYTSWSLPVSAISNGDTVCTSSVAGNATLNEQSQYISIPSEVFNEFAFYDQGFICDSDNNNCSTYASCNQTAAYLPTIKLEITGNEFNSTPASFSLYIEPEFYLWQNTTSGMCELLVNTTSGASPSYVLGQPFLRRYGMYLFYSTNYVAFPNQTAPNSTISAIDTNPVASTTDYLLSTMTVSLNQSSYMGSIGFGNASAVTSNNNVAFDTIQQLTILVATDCNTCISPSGTAGWFNEFDSSLLLDSTDIQISYAGTSINGSMSQTPYSCVGGTLNGTSSKVTGYDGLCVEGLTSYLARDANNTFLNNSYQAVLGMGQIPVDSYDSQGYPQLNSQSIQYSLPYLAWLASPNYAPTACFSYYWNCSDYSTNDCGNLTSQVVLGQDDCLTNSTLMGTSMSSDMNDWAVNLTSMTFDSTISALSNAPAYIMSANPYISVDNAYWNATQTTLESKNFTCSNITDYYNTKQCVRTGSCSEISSYMPSLLLETFATLEIYPSEYLADDFTNNQCIALISTNEQNFFALGQPFLRSYDLKLNYNTTEITVYSNNKQDSSPVEGSWSSIGSTFTETITFVDSLVYYGPAFVGTPLQYPNSSDVNGTNYMLYSTQSSLSYFPVVNVSSIGWYDPSTSTSAVQVNSNSTNFTIDDAWSGTYTTYNDTVCLNSTLTNSSISSCASNLTFAAVDTLTSGDNSSYAGIIGLGKPSGDNTNFVIEWAAQNHQQACAIFTLGFNANDSYIQFGVENSQSFDMLGTGLAEADVWSLNVSAFLVANMSSWGHVDGFALMDSGAQYIGLPQWVWSDIDIEQYNFFCDYDTYYCQTMQSCEIVASQMDVLNVTIVGDASVGGDFTLHLSPQFFLWQNETTGYCDFQMNVTADGSDYPYIFGQPFFRQYQIMMNYTSNQISIFDNNAVSPIAIVDKYPEANTSYVATSTFDVDTTNQYYYSGIAIGAANALQTSGNVAIDLQGWLTFVPAQNCTTCGAAWFDQNDTSLLLDSSELDEWTLTNEYYGQAFQAPYTCINATLAENTTGLSQYEGLCVQNFTSMVVWNVTDPITGGYVASLGLFQPEAYDYYDDGYPILYPSDTMASFPIQAWLQNPNYYPTVCLSYYWNCDDYDNASQCDNKTSQVIFGNNSCFDNSTSLGKEFSLYEWSIDIYTYTFGNQTNSTESFALISSTVPYISVDEGYWNSTQEVLQSKNFTCSYDDDQDLTLYSCYREGACEDIVLYMPNLILESFVDLELHPQTYLVDNFTNNTCNCLITANDWEIFVLGEPFLRAYDVMLNFNTTEIEIFDNLKYQYSPVQDQWTNLGSTWTQTMNLSDSQYYYGPVYVGDPAQSPGDANSTNMTNFISYDTQQSMSYFPTLNGTTNGWYNASASSNSTEINSTVTSFDISGGWSGNYTLWNDSVCLNSSATSSALSSCVTDLTFAAVTQLSNESYSYEYNGILGLGKVDDENTNFALEWAMQNHQTPVAFFDMGFNENDTYVQFGLDEYANYNFEGMGLSEASTWSLNVTEFAVDNVTQYYSVEGFALLANQVPYIGVPEDLFYDLSLEEYGLMCPEDDGVYYSYMNCSELAAYLGEVNITIQGDTANGFEDFTLNLSPEFYLYQNSTTGFCQLLVDTTTDEEYPYILGAPFFRQYQLMFNYTSNQVGVIYKESTSSIVAVDKFPTPNPDMTATATLSVDTSNQFYTGGLALGGSTTFQNSTKVAYDTFSSRIVVTSTNCTNCTNGWFNQNADGIIIDSDYDWQWVGVDTDAEGFNMQAQYTCINATLDGGQNSSLTNYEGICVQGMTTFVAEQIWNYNDDEEYLSDLLDGYDAVLGLNMPGVEEYYDNGYPKLYVDDTLASFPYQMWVQDPNYAPVVCFSYYWNCDEYTDNQCYDKPSEVLFGDDNCYSSQDYASNFSVSDWIWAINITSYSFNDYENDTQFEGWLMSQAPYISIDETHWNETQAVFESFDFNCTNTTDWLNSVTCSYVGPCEDLVLYMPNIYMQSYIELSFGPQEYLIDNLTDGTCNSLISTNEDELFILGEPFFRSYNVKLNFNTTEITLFKNNKYWYSPVQGAWPEPDESVVEAEEPIVMPPNENLTAGGPLYVGNDYQGGANLAVGYNSISAWTVIPSQDCVDCPSAWFNSSSDLCDCEIVDDETFEITLGDKGEYTATCTEVKAKVCLDKNTADTCAKISFCMASAFSGDVPYSLDGILGLGLPGVDNSNSYVVQNILQNGQSSTMVFDVNYDESDPSSSSSSMGFSGGSSNDEVTDAGSTGILTDYWSLVINQTAFGGDPVANGDPSDDVESSAGGISSSSQYISVGSEIFSQVQVYLEAANFSMEIVDSQYIYTYQGVCNSDWMNEWPSLSMTWVYVVDGALSDDSYDLVVPPYSYLIGKNNGTTCNCLITTAVTTSAGLLGAGSSSGVNLGGPFFRNFKIEMDYITQGVQLYGKTVESPYNPVWVEEKAAANSTSIGLYELIGIIAGGIVFILMIVFVGWVCYRKSQETTYEAIDTAPAPETTAQSTNQAGANAEFKSVDEAPPVSTNIQDA